MAFVNEQESLGQRRQIQPQHRGKDTLPIEYVDGSSIPLRSGFLLMPIAVGTIQTLGFPPIIAAADAMVKAARVTITQYGLAESAQFFVSVRGPVSEVETAVEAGLKAVAETEGAELINYIVIPNPQENVETVMPIDFTAESEPFRS